MLMRDPEHKRSATATSDHRASVQNPQFVEHSPREILLGQILWMLLLVIAILLRSIS